MELDTDNGSGVSRRSRDHRVSYNMMSGTCKSSGWHGAAQIMEKATGNAGVENKMLCTS